MGFFSRQNAEQSSITDQVHDVIKRLGTVTQGAGVLSKETNLDARDILAALDLLEEEGKIVRTIMPKDAPAK
jgi:hypothetical protein